MRGRLRKPCENGYCADCDNNLCGMCCIVGVSCEKLRNVMISMIGNQIRFPH